MLLAFGLDRDARVDQALRDLGILGLDRGVVLTIRPAIAHGFAIKRDLAHAAAVHCRHKLGIRHCEALEGVARPAEQVEQREDQQEQHQPEGNISCVTQGFSPKIRIPVRLAQGVLIINRDHGPIFNDIIKA